MRSLLRLRSLVRGELRLKFRDARVERQYRHHEFRESLAGIRLSLILGIFLYGSFGIVDLFAFPEAIGAVAFVRFGLVLPVIAILFAYSYHRSFERTRDWTVSFGVLWAGAGIIAIIDRIAMHPQQYYYVGLIIVIFYAYHFLRLRFVYATAVAWLFVAGYLTLSLLSPHVPVDVLLNNNFFMVTAAITGMVSGYLAEYYHRCNYLQFIQLDEQDKQLESVAGNVPGAVYRQVGWGDGHRTFPYVSDGLRTVFGIDPEAVMAEPDILSERVHPEDRQGCLEAERRSAEQLARLEHEMRLVAPDGIKWVRVMARPHLDASGTVAWDGIILDITELKSREASLRQAQKTEAVGQLTGGIAHDFNNLLTVMLGNAEHLAEEFCEDEQARESAQMIVDTAERGAQLTSRLLAFSRRQDLLPCVVDVNELIRELTPLLSRTIGSHIEIDVRQQPDISRTLVDISQLENSLINLAVNARDAMPEGGRLVIATSNVAIDETYAALDDEFVPGNYVRIAVTDNGVGMPEAVRVRVFEPFFTTKDKGHGTGLGLSMVYGFVRQSQGNLTIYSEVGHGTTINIYLPVAEADSMNDSPPVHAPGLEALEAGDEAILVVEDNADVRRHAVRMLRSLGYRVHEAENGREALKRLQGGTKIDLVFTDLVMPGGMLGSELGRAVKAFDPGIKVLHTTGYADRELIGDDIFSDPGGIISKPYRKKDLAQKIRSVLDGD